MGQKAVNCGSGIKLLLLKRIHALDTLFYNPNGWFHDYYGRAEFMQADVINI